MITRITKSFMQSMDEVSHFYSTSFNLTATLSTVNVFNNALILSIGRMKLFIILVIGSKELRATEIKILVFFYYCVFNCMIHFYFYDYMTYDVKLNSYVLCTALFPF